MSLLTGDRPPHPEPISPKWAEPSPGEYPANALDISFTLNDKPVSLRIEPQDLLLDVLRERLKLTGAKRSCDVQVCGTCTVLLDEEPISSCCTLAADVAGRVVLTIEGLAQLAEFQVLEQAFMRHAALQCGFCTPGMLLTIKALLDAGELLPDEAEIKRSLSGNLCRCTGYRGILEAVRELADHISGRTPEFDASPGAPE
jgi:aerobic carbon-monoxide dehydrogenase small subunit